MTGYALVTQVILNGLMGASIYILVGLGLTLLLSVANTVQLAHGEIYMMGGYFTYYFIVLAGLSYIPALLLTVVVWSLLGIVIERVFFRAFHSQADFFPALVMATGLMVLINTTGEVFFGSTTKVMKTPFPGVLKIGGAVVSWERLIVVVVSVVFVVALLAMLRWTRLGQAMVAVSQDMQGASLQGINVAWIATVAMIIGCGLAALAGGLMGAVFSLSPSVGGPALMKGIAVIILGGFGSVPGAVLGGLILGFVDSVVPLFASVQMASLVGFVLIILILVFRPQGLLGRPSA